MWIARNPIGGIPLMKSPIGMSIAPFRPAVPARLANPVDDHAGETQDHSDENDEMGGMLPGAEGGSRRAERVLGGVEDETEGDRRGPELRQPRDRSIDQD